MSMPTPNPNSGNPRRHSLISSCLAKPHNAVNGVNAIAISGLWLSSLYASGFSACSISARRLSGCDYIDKAVPTDKTLNRNGKLSPYLPRTTAPKANGWFSSHCCSCSPLFAIVDGPLLCVPIHSSAYGLLSDISSPPACKRQATSLIDASRPHP